MAMTHVLVEWLNEDPKQFSVCKVSEIADGDLRRTTGLELEGKVTRIQWKRKEYPGKILKIGSEEELEAMADDLAAKEHEKDVTPRKRAKPGVQRKSKAVQNLINLKSSVSEVLSSISISQASTEDHVEHSVTHDADSATENTEETKAQKYKRKYKALRSKYQSLKEKYNSLVSEITSEEMIELSPQSGVRIRKADLDRMKIVSNQVTVLARNLFRHFFSMEELSSHSLYGKQCNANKASAPPLPAIDGVRRDAVINYILKIHGLDKEDVALDKDLLVKRKGVRREITKTLSDFLREEHRKSNRQ